MLFLNVDYWVLLLRSIRLSTWHKTITRRYVQKRDGVGREGFIKKQTNDQVVRLKPSEKNTNPGTCHLHVKSQFVLEQKVVL